MDLKLFFDPLDDSRFTPQPPTSFFSNIHVNLERMPKLDGMEIAIIGVPESRGSARNIGTEFAPDEVRRKLYGLKKGYGAYKIIDLGNLRPGHSLEETHGRLTEVCRYLLEKNLLPLIIGGSQDLDYAQYKAYEDLEKLISVLNVDAFMDMEEDAEFMDLKHIQKILLHDPNYLFHYSQLAYQSYLIDQKTLDVLEMLGFESHRLGKLRTNFEEVEPVIRSADMLTFDISALKSADAPGSINAQPFGLTGEEACQICWYAGLNEKLSSAGFYEYNPELDGPLQKTASVVATMIWYFIEGFYHRKNEQVFRQNDYIKFVVSLGDNPEDLTFYKSKLSEKWWMEISIAHPSNRYNRTIMIPCSYSDYTNAAKGEIPDRYIEAQARYT